MDIDEREGVSAFYRDKNGDIYRTYSSYERGIDLMNTTYNFLDLTAKGRDENPDATQDWVRYHDEYKKGQRTAAALEQWRRERRPVGHQIMMGSRTANHY